jgi:hypothetical protein
VNEEKDWERAIRLAESPPKFDTYIEPFDEKAYWASKTMSERLEATELLRQISFGYDPNTARMRRAIRFDKLGRDDADDEPLRRRSAMDRRRAIAEFEFRLARRSRE